MITAVPILAAVLALGGTASAVACGGGGRTERGAGVACGGGGRTESGAGDGGGVVVTSS